MALVVVLTPAAKGSDWVANEVAYAQHHDVPVIPVLARTLLLPVDLLVVGTIVSAIDEQGRRIGDMAAGTRVEPVAAASWVGPVRPF